MATKIYRYRLQVPGAPIDQISSEVGSVVAIYDHAGGVVIDIACDDAFAAELVDSMENQGFEFVNSGPTNYPYEQFVIDNKLLDGAANVGLGQGVFKERYGLLLNFRSISSGSGIKLLRSDDEVIVESTTLKDHHRSLRHLIHFIDEGPADGFLRSAFKETLPSGSSFPTSVTWYTDSGQTTKIIEKIITRTGGGASITKPTPITWVLYGEDGEVLAKVIDTIVYAGVLEYQRSREIKILAFVTNEVLVTEDDLTTVVA